MSDTNESAPGPGRSQRLANYDSANASRRRGRPDTAGIPQLALTPTQAAQALSVSPDFFDEHVRGELRWVRRGRKALVAVDELRRWLDASAARTLEEHR
jgi:hypothetical protein